MTRRSWKQRLTLRGRVSEATHERMCQDSGYWASCALGEALGMGTAQSLERYLSGYNYNDQREWWWDIPENSMKTLAQHGMSFHKAVCKKKWNMARTELQFITSAVRAYRRMWRKGVREMVKAGAVLCAVGLLAAACSLESPVVRSIRSADNGIRVTSCHRGLPPGKGGNIVTGLTEECGEYTVAVK